MLRKTEMNTIKIKARSAFSLENMLRQLAQAKENGDKIEVANVNHVENVVAVEADEKAEKWIRSFYKNKRHWVVE